MRRRNCRRKSGALQVSGYGRGDPEFSDGTFDVLVTRNLTWTLPDAGKKAYREWSRVLKEDGVLLNF